MTKAHLSAWVMTLNPALSDENCYLLTKAFEQRELVKEPLVGDILLIDGKLRRISVIHESGKIQTTTNDNLFTRNFFLNSGGGVQFSGGSDFNIYLQEDISVSKRIDNAMFVIFDKFQCGAGKALNCVLPVKICLFNRATKLPEDYKYL